MVFTVPEDFEGSFVLSTLKKALWSGMIVSIHGPNLYAPDVKMAIKQGRLIPLGEEYDEKQANLSHEAMIVNRTDKVLILGKIILKPWASQMIDKHIAMSANIKSAERNGFVHIISDETSYEEKTAKKKMKTGSKEKKTSAKKKVEIIEVEDETPEYSIPEIGADREVKAKVWDFRDKSSEDAQVVPKASDIIKVDEEEAEEVEFVDKPVEVQQVASKKKAKRKTKKKTKKKVKRATKKKAAKKTIKKKGKAAKKRKVKSVEPVGENRDVAIELDSHGRLLSADETLQHLIDSLAEPEEISFVDNEQAQERHKKRTDMD